MPDNPVSGDSGPGTLLLDPRTLDPTDAMEIEGRIGERPMKQEFSDARP
jgi:hypothetical protein